MLFLCGLCIYPLQHQTHSSVSSNSAARGHHQRQALGLLVTLWNGKLGIWGPFSDPAFSTGPGHSMDQSCTSPGTGGPPVTGISFMCSLAQVEWRLRGFRCNVAALGARLFTRANRQLRRSRNPTLTNPLDLVFKKLVLIQSQPGVFHMTAPPPLKPAASTVVNRSALVLAGGTSILVNETSVIRFHPCTGGLPEERLGSSKPCPPY